ncbi:MAG TPA: class I SAM-dependent methyltransferase [Candidatus Sulfotelmatobacter sp.]|nr:class I SAM-dependent methyltransferase [Candidatus Sulfotelmatobacter sp.]
MGDEVLEVGPGPGLTTDWLRCRSKSITCIEVDPSLANSLCRRTANTNVSVRCADATPMPFPDRLFSSAVCFTVLHHLPSAALQNRLFAEVYRVLRPGSVFVGVDSMRSLLMRIFHVRDTMLPVDPVALPGRLQSAGFRDMNVAINAGRFRFFARRPFASSPVSTAKSSQATSFAPCQWLSLPSKDSALF